MLKADNTCINCRYKNGIRPLNTKLGGMARLTSWKGHNKEEWSIMQSESRYTNDQIARIQREFQMSLWRDRRKQRIWFTVFGILFVAGFALVYLSPSSYTNLIIWLFVICVAILAIALVKIHPRLKCPGCHMTPEGSFGNYCPECGSLSLKIINRRNARCAHCNRRMSYSIRGIRHFKIRVCTHCGVPLSRSGY